MLLEKILRQSADSPGLHLRDAVYGDGEQACLLREVMGLANASANGPRYIAFGAVRDDAGQLVYTALGKGGLEQLQGYIELVKAYIEPELSLETFYGDVEGHLVAALEIKACANPPYVLKMDASKSLARGACWVREGGMFRPAQRADLDRMYRVNRAKAPVDSSKNLVQIGFENDPARTRIGVRLPDVSNPPSQRAAGRMIQKIEAKKEAADVSLEDTAVARLVHARLYDDDQKFEDQGINTLVQGYNAVIDDCREEDDYYYFEANAIRLNFCLVNTGQMPLEDVSLMLTFPRAEELRVAEHIYGPPGSAASARESELMGYPQVKSYKSAVQVRQDYERLAPDELQDAFEQPLRLAIRPEIAGKRLAVRYTLQAKGLQQPEEGVLKLIFKA
jgi:hypothetical protein